MECKGDGVGRKGWEGWEVGRWEVGGGSLGVSDGGVEGWAVGCGEQREKATALSHKSSGVQRGRRPPQGCVLWGWVLLP